MECPKCDGTLEVVVEEKIEIDRCNECGGLWFDRLETDRLLKVKDSAKSVDVVDAYVGEQQNAIGKIDCPRCHTQMIRMVDLEQHHIWYESCTVCGGKWFDSGEFRDLQEETIMDFFRGLFARERE